jgi:hypothetical protein
LVSGILWVRAFAWFAQDKFFMRVKKHLAQLLAQLFVPLETNLDDSVVCFLGH